MSRVAHLHLFEGFGIEAEYMIVDRDTLAVSPIADQILLDENGRPTEELELGETAWSNELVKHVIEIKTNGPTKDLRNLASLFHRDIERINAKLASYNAMLMPTAMHPLMRPLEETQLWDHGYNEIYAQFNRIFNCQGHGWSNLQSVHINFPFANDEEFARLHTAVRLVLPLLPSLAASSPVVEGKWSGDMDARLEFYRHNQRRLPDIAGFIVPEAVFSQQEYQQKILAKLYQAIRPFDAQGILQEEWLNSRGAIARFDRHAIEIRLLDIQECPRADIAVVALVTGVVQALTEERWASFKEQSRWQEQELHGLLLNAIKYSDEADFKSRDYLKMFGLQKENYRGLQVWEHLASELRGEKNLCVAAYQEELATIFSQGSLARRILNATQVQPQENQPKSQPAVAGTEVDPMRLRDTYRRLCDCLRENKMFRSHQESSRDNLNDQAGSDGLTYLSGLVSRSS